MTDSRRNDSWHGASRGLHWLMASLMVVQIIIGWVAGSMERSPLKVDVMTAHKSLGMTLMLLLLVRLMWRWTQHAPPPIGSRWQVNTARWVHGGLYLLMAALPLSGWLSASTSVVPWKLWWLIPWPAIAAPDKRLHEFANNVHETLVWCLLALLTMHVGAALWHHFVRRDRVLLRMLRGRS